MAAYDLGQDKLYGHIKPKKNRTTFLEFCRYPRSLYPPEVRIAIVLDNFSPHHRCTRSSSDHRHDAKIERRSRDKELRDRHSIKNLRPIVGSFSVPTIPGR